MSESCEQIQAELSEYVDAELAADRVGAVEEHLKTCSACAQYLRTLRETVELCRRTPRPCVGEDCLQRAVSAAREELARRGLITR